MLFLRTGYILRSGKGPPFYSISLNTWPHSRILSFIESKKCGFRHMLHRGLFVVRRLWMDIYLCLEGAWMMLRLCSASMAYSLMLTTNDLPDGRQILFLMARSQRNR